MLKIISLVLIILFLKQFSFAGEEKKITNKDDCRKILDITFCTSKNDDKLVEFDVLKKSPLRIIIGKTNTKETPPVNALAAAAYKHCKSYNKKTNIFSGTSNYTSGEGFYDQDITIETEKFTRFYCGEPKDIAKKFMIRDEGYNSVISEPLRIRGVASNGNIGSGILISNLIKPKKEKPKSIADDDKIVPAGSGSGFFVSSNGTVITNHHVIEGCKINKVSHKGSQYEAKVLAVDKVNDIAILKTNITPDRVFSVSNEDVSLLEDVVVAGYPLGKQVSSAIKTHKGVVTALAGAGDNYSNFQTDASINQGNSGGPILDQKGNVVGIAVATWVEEGVQGVHFGIKSSTLKTFASANGLKFLPANNRDLSNKDLGKLIMQSTVYVECHMTIASIKKMIAEAENKKAFFKEFE